MQRERLSSRLGFLLLSAGCAIGLGNVWRFPYIVGRYGGAAFVLLYLFFLLALGLPIVVMEFSVGRASQKSVARSFDVLEPPGSRWHLYKYPAIAGNVLLMMFYTTVAGWMLLYFFKLLRGEFTGLSAQGVSDVFDAMLAEPAVMTAAMAAVVVGCFAVCSLGLQRGVERVTKAIMLCLFAIMLALAARAVTLPGAAQGLRFYLNPDFHALAEHGIPNAVFAAMGQAFFTLSIGMGSLAIFGSYIGREHRLTGEAVRVMALDTAVALLAGLIIFPACFSFGVRPDSGPRLLFVTLPNVFNRMAGGRLFGAFFFLFLCCAALSTVIAVFENLISCVMELKHWSRKKVCLTGSAAMILLSLPCVLGFNVLRAFAPFGPGSTVLDLEDFLVSNNLLPLGSLVYLLFCVTRYGWGWDSFCREANTGKGLRFPAWARYYVTYVLPAIVLAVLVQGYMAAFGK